jgi:hypothetical protein
LFSISLQALSFPAARLLPKSNKGVTYSRSATGTGMPFMETLSGTPGLGVLSCAIHEIKITSFVADSSRSYAKCNFKI